MKLQIISEQQILSSLEQQLTHRQNKKSIPIRRFVIFYGTKTPLVRRLARP